ncbi:DUF1501 domain-containing protein [Kaistia dalseonensis]|uniref:Uncharacterized protein (DUF1501 family) n=1 Tax=Kaistia dalseonensis TaxID=410840 RepID=A0ABU0H099_9HYPH|nr:DUF1501 domain-containing protein [Kaistia dalseonensis]MCX5493183.1 DUF1501 domain-containing protein [Kaistia dalseonensis]MDQ0435738.1 uncharacterized protein (DUF1501 family) [Kaistia dalseonensis]
MNANDGLLRPSRRLFLAGAGAFVAWAQMPRFAFAGTRDPRFVVVILRGALDGLAVVPPIADPEYPELRGDLAIGSPGQGGTLPLGGFFALNDAMPNLHARYQKREALIVHAAASAYRDRSHFDGQDVLESGMAGPRMSRDGWLNRAADALPKGGAVRPTEGLAVSATVPLVLRGRAPVFTWMPAGLQPAGMDTADRLMDLYTHADPELGRVFSAGRMVDKMAAGGSQIKGGGLDVNFRRISVGAARLLAEEDGPRLAALSYDGWDTHANEGPEDGRLGKLLAALDGALDGLAAELAPVWSDTVVAVMTEFGRTARTNGTEGTDHGTATTAFLMGGAVKGGRVLADWPGLKPSQLYQGRDLAATTDLRGVLKGVLRDHLGISEATLSTRIFPDSIGVKPIDDLIA